ncbi:uncharacterized protein BP01DRAFT_394860 [Aspergillus saccharolyticus JOP 1030-1]|uniref:Uncharacterized protein n=1 Tax=Aspergillus saccharolyticus JOP 1030-1 TaxID=1450539 RepID=A0A318Z310_9EURO|nr:hypothetical protein BP01DRAFT_394860 [Aspergillus saccharolyticus JOP 1030-1]PYH41655.1 hypothetical protein BP01DRAFT_394860 [Aspergillus saccharolyticus JOP 1030-1]
MVEIRPTRASLSAILSGLWFVVAGSLFLGLLIYHAFPGMCHSNCDSEYSPRKIWQKITLQIFNALWCIYHFGLAPFHICDMYLWCHWRLGCSLYARQTALAGLIYNKASWFRLNTQDAMRHLPLLNSDADDSVEWESIGLEDNTPGQSSVMRSLVFQVVYTIYM